MAALMTLIIGATGIWAGLPRLFPSLAPTIMLQVHQPLQPSARVYSVLVGHAAGIAAGVVGVLLAHAGHEPSVMAANLLTWPRVWASVIAMVVMFVLMFLTKAPHPPAVTTALLISLRGFSVTWKSMLVLGCGVLLVAVLGEMARRLRE